MLLVRYYWYATYTEWRNFAVNTGIHMFFCLFMITDARRAAAAARGQS